MKSEKMYPLDQGGYTSWYAAMSMAQKLKIKNWVIVKVGDYYQIHIYAKEN